MSGAPWQLVRRAALAPVAFALAVLAGCRTPPPPHPAVEAARQALQQASADPYVVAGASVELDAARTELARADAAWSKERDEPLTRHLSHLAHQRALLAGQVGRQHEAEARLAKAAQEREQLRAGGGSRRGATATAAAQAAPPPPRVVTPAPTPQAVIAPPPAPTPQTVIVPPPAPAPQVVTVPPPTPTPTPQAATAPPPAPTGQLLPPSRPQAPPAPSRFDNDTELRARMDLEAQRRRAEAARGGQAAMAPPQAAPGRERNQALRQQLEQLQARDTQRGMVLTLPDVLFASGGARLRRGNEPTLDQLVAVMQRFPERRVLLEGFTDDVGPETRNYDLSQMRAETLRRALLARGADARRIDISAQGEAFPVASNASATGRAQNRRVEVIFSDEHGRFAPR